MDRRAQHAKQEEDARRWAAWLIAEMERAGISGSQLRAGLGERYAASTVSIWRAARQRPSERAAILTAQLLGAEPVDALRAAGHEEMADFIKSLIDASPRPGLLSEDDPVVVQIFAVSFDAKVRMELLGMRATDLAWLQDEGRRRERRLLEIVEERGRGL